MHASAEHARQAGAALGSVLSNGVREIKNTHAKVNVGAKVNVIVSDHVYQHFNKPVRAVFNHALYPGKLVVELIPDELKGRSISPFRPGERRVNWDLDKVPGCGRDFAKFGMTAPDSVVLGRDGVLRITLPAKRRPLQDHSPRAKIIKKPAVKPQSLTEKESARSPVMVAGDNVLTMKQKDTMVSFVPSGLSVRTGRELAKYLEGGRYGITNLSQTDDGKEVHVTVTQGAANYVLGTTKFGLNKDQRCLKIMNVKPTKGQVPHFGLTQASEVLVIDEGRQIVLTMREPFTPPGAKTYRGKRPVKYHKPASRAEKEPVTEVTMQESTLTKLRRLRDDINACVKEAKDAGDEVTLRLKEDGSLGFTYEG